MSHFTPILQRKRPREERVEDDLIVLGHRAGLSILRENSDNLCYREAAIRGRYGIRLMEKHLWRTE